MKFYFDLFLNPLFLGCVCLFILGGYSLLLWRYRRLRFKLEQTLEDMSLLEQETRKLRGMLDGVSIPIWHRDPHLRIDGCNAAYAAALEKDRAQILGTDQELTHHKKRQQKLAHAAVEGQTTTHDFFHTVIGQKRSLMHVHEVYHQNHHVGYALDYTLLERSEDLLKQHIEAQQSLLENLSTGIGVFGADTRLQFFNRAYVQISGSQEAWLSTHPTLSEILEDMRAHRRLPEYSDFPAYKRARLAQFTDLIQLEEEMTYRPDGHTVRRVTAPYPKGGLVYMFEDVTDRLTLEQQYHTLMAVQRETLNSLYEGIVVFGSDHRIKLLNPAFTQVWRLKEAVVGPGTHIEDFLKAVRLQFMEEEEWETYQKSMTTTLSERISTWGQISYRGERLLDFKYIPLPDGAHLFTYMDTTDQYKVERALRERNQALEDADALKSQFIAHISYELRTPLNTIIGFTEILENHYFGELNAPQHDYTQGTLKASRQLLSLIDDLLDLATLESQDVVLDAHPTDVGDFLRTVERLVEKRVQDARLDLLLQIPQALPPLTIDRRRIKHALCHLISNSIKFTEEGGKITLGATYQGNWITLWIQDTGIGIPEPDQGRIFGKFERGQYQHIRQHGAGIGLYLVKSFVELHGGHVRIESLYNVGTTVYCYLPVTPTEYFIKESPQLSLPI